QGPQGEPGIPGETGPQGIQGERGPRGSGGGSSGGTAELEYLDLSGMASPGVSVAGSGYIYFDQGENKFKVSEDGGAYVDLIGPGGAGIDGLGTVGYLSVFTDADTLGDSIIFQDGTEIGI